ncbi:MAG TPA: TonB family protein [Gemmatimonadaceae bacterium]
MFGTLLESKGVKVRRQGGAVVSILAHTVVIGAVIAGTARATRAPVPPREPPTPVVYQVLTPIPRSATPRTAAPAPSTRAPVPGEITIPVRTPDFSHIPTTLPPIDAPLGEALPHIGAAPVGLSPGVVGDPGPGRGEPWASGAVERVAKLRSRVEPAYPRALVSSGLEGRVVIRFIVDTLGRVEAKSIEAVESTHALFTEAARAAIGRARFEPAQVGGRPVRMLMELPFVFELER